MVFVIREKKSRRSCERREKPGADSRGGVALRRTGGAKVPPDVPTSKCATDDALETRARPLENRTTKM